MPKQRNIHQDKQMEQAKTRALMGLLDALAEERIPPRAGSLQTGKIESYFDDEFRPVRRRALLNVLRDAGIPHDTAYRFVAHDFYDLYPQLHTLYRERIGLATIPSHLVSATGILPQDGGNIPRIVGAPIPDQNPRNQQ